MELLVKGNALWLKNIHIFLNDPIDNSKQVLRNKLYS